MSNLIKEILDMVALPYKWIDKHKALFEYDDKKYGIYVDYFHLKLSTMKTADVANISFGIIKNDNFSVSNDLDTSITNFGKPRTILSTVAEACLSNKDVVNCDIISLASADQIKEKRTLVYSLALAEIRNKVKEFSVAKDLNIKSKNGTVITLLSKIEFTEEEQKEITKELEIDKF